MKKWIQILAAALVIVLALTACSGSKQEDPRTVHSVEGTVQALSADKLTLVTKDQNEYIFSIGASRRNTAAAPLEVSATVTIFYTGTLNTEAKEQTGAAARIITVTSGPDHGEAEPAAKEPTAKLVANYAIPSQSDYAAALEREAGDGLETVWKNDEAAFPLTIFASGTPLNKTTVAVSDLTSGKAVLSGKQAQISFLKETKAYVGNATYGPETDLLKESFPDILDPQESADIPARALQNVWVSIPIPADAAPGLYKGEIDVSSPALSSGLKLPIQVRVLDLEAPNPEDYSFDVELWQYPYRIAQYYGVEAFGEEHLQILRGHMEKYKGLGGHAITASIVEEPWNGQTYGQYPSMIKWTKTREGSFSFDFHDFDQWVSLCKEMGIGDKIVCYSLIPWENKITYYDEKSQSEKSVSPKTGSKQYRKIWTQFLEALIGHSEEKGWFDSVYIGIDEREDMDKAFDVVEAVKGKNGKSLKISAAMDHFSEEHFPVIDRIASISVGSEAVKKAAGDYKKLVEHRKKDAALDTTVYTCTGHYPNTFTYSLPLESYWVMLYSGSMGATGYLRWALDAWVEDPLRDTSYKTFEAGDCFLLYPDEVKSSHRQSKSSVRFEMLRKGLRDVNKLYWISQQGEVWKAKTDALFATVKSTYSNVGDGIADPEAQKEIPADMQAFMDGMNQLSTAYQTSRHP